MSKYHKHENRKHQLEGLQDIKLEEPIEEIDIAELALEQLVEVEYIEEHYL